MARNAFVPMAWVTSDLNGEALRTLILLSSYADAETGECWPSNAVIAKALGKSTRAVQFSLDQLKESGFVSILDGQGRGRRIRIESKEWYSRPSKKAHNHEENLHGSTMKKTFTVQKCNHEENLHGNHEENLHGNHEENLHGPNKNTPIEHTQEQKEERSSSQESKPADFAGDCSLALSDLGQKPPPIPAEIKRMATEVNALAWIANVQFQEIPMTDWRVKETLRAIQARGGNKGVNYAWKIFNDLPETEPPKTNGHVNGNGKYRPNEPTHVPNLMPRRVKSHNENTLTDFWNRLADLPIPGVEVKAWSDRMHEIPTDIDPAAYSAALENILTEATETVK